MAKDSIKISPKHGLNPCIPVCVFCGKEKQEIALLGRMKDDRKAPMSAVLNYEPCDECLAKWQQGVPLLRVTETPEHENQPSVKAAGGEEIYISGSFLVVKPEFAARALGIKREAGMPVYLEAPAFDHLVDKAKEAEEQP